MLEYGDSLGPALTVDVLGWQWGYERTNPAFPSDSLRSLATKSADLVWGSGKRCLLSSAWEEPSEGGLGLSESLTPKVVLIESITPGSLSGATNC